MYIFTSENQIEDREIQSFMLISPGIVALEPGAASQCQWQLIKQGSLKLIAPIEGDIT